jgi:1,2-diacylglycerol 3-alpha-glucosyltransferase
MRVAFFQRVFAHYQIGLMKELSSSSDHTYSFFGENRDPLSSGIEPVSEDAITMLPYTVCRTIHWGRHIAFQWKAVDVALRGRHEAIILEGGATILTNWPAMIISRLRGKRVLLYTHGWIRDEHGIKKMVMNIFYRFAHGLLLYGMKARAIGTAYGFDPERMYVVYNSLDDESIRHHMDSLSAAMQERFLCEWFGEEPRYPIIVCVGRLNAVKKYPLLLEAASILKNEGVGVNIMLVGEGPERCVLVEQAAELGVPLKLAGAQYDEDFLSRALTSAAMTVIPGWAGLSVIHSLSYGTPVVIHDNDDEQAPEVEAVKQGVNGARFREGDAADLARAILCVVKTLPKTPEVERRCRSVIDEAYSPGQMRKQFDAAVSGVPASGPTKAH